MSAVDSIPWSPIIAIESYAWAHFMRTYVDTRVDIPDNHWSYIKEHCEVHDSGVDTVLQSTMTALALLTFGRLQKSPVALQQSIRKYNQAVNGTYTLLRDVAQAYDDRTLLGVMLLDSYENISGNKYRRSSGISQDLHLTGAETLLKLRNDEQILPHTGPSLNRDIRRRIIRSCIIRGCRVPEWLENGAKFGEDGWELQLDICLVRAAQLRFALHEFLRYWSKASQPQEQRYAEKARIIVCEALATDSDLVAWAVSLPSDWSYKVHDRCPENGSSSNMETESLFYGEEIYTYSSLEIARAWDLYRGARLVTNSIIAGPQAFRSLGYCGVSYLTQQKTAEANIKTLVNEICASIPFFFGWRDSSTLQTTSIRQDRKDALVFTGYTPRTAFLTVFGLCAAGSMLTIPNEQQRWIALQIMHVSEATGSCALEALAKGNPAWIQRQAVQSRHS